MSLRPTHSDGSPIHTAAELNQQIQSIADLHLTSEAAGSVDTPALDLGETAATQLSLEPVVEPANGATAPQATETRQEQYLRELEDDRADRDALVGWQETDEAADVRRADIGTYMPRPTRHIRRIGPIQPRGYKGMSKYVPTHVPSGPGRPNEQEIDRNLRRVRQLRTDLQEARQQAEEQRRKEERERILKAARDSGLTT